MSETAVCDQPATAGPERRIVSRHSCYSDLRVHFDGTIQHVPVRAPDISSRGMFINTPQVFPLGAILTIRFQLGNSGKQVQARGEVRYCLEGVGIGVEFTDLPQDAHDAIVTACEREAEW